MARDADQHFLSTVERDFLMSVKCGSPQPTDAADDGPDSRPFASAKNSAQQSAGTSPDRSMLDAFAASTT